MCNLSKGVEERGIARGLAQGLERGLETGILNAIRNLMETMKLTAEQAMEALKVPEAEKVKYAGMLKG
jgi:predicted transposase YdaD